MKALLLAAGFGTRLRPITNKVPKCLVPIHGKPLLGYWLDLLLPAAIDQVLINTHYLPKLVQDFVDSHPWKNRIKLVHENQLLGTAGTVLKNREWLGDEPFLLAHADNLTQFDVQAFLKAHKMRKQGVEITMMTFKTDTPQSCGIVECDLDNIVIGFHEKISHPPGDEANAAVYIIEPNVIEFIESQNSEILDFSTQVLPHFLTRIQTFCNTGYHRDIGTPESLRLAHLEFVNTLSYSNQ